MYEIIKRYCENKNKNGLLLLDMPTGSGKTYSVINYIYDSVQDPSNKKRFFFLTTLKKNLPEKDLEKRFEVDGKMKLFREKYLRVDPNYESLLNGFTPEIKKMIPIDIKATNEYKAVEQYVNLIQNLRKENKQILHSALAAAEDSLRKDLEPHFRKMIQKRLARRYPKIEDRSYAVKYDKDWKWVAGLYPSVFMRDRQIIFMSMDKFLSINSTIIAPSSMLYDSDLIDNSVIFIDEFDATKDTVLKNIIKNGLHEKIDCMELFHTIYSSLESHRFPVQLTNLAKKEKKKKSTEKSLQHLITKIKIMAEKIYDTYSLQFNYRTEEVLDTNKNNFLFQDHQYHSIGNKTYISMFTNMHKQLNMIRFTDDPPKSGDKTIQKMLYEISGFVSYFMGMVHILAVNYQACKKENDSCMDDFSLEEAIRTVLSEFKLTASHIDYLTDKILFYSYKYKDKLDSDPFDLSFYEKGFSFYRFVDDYAHDMQSRIMMLSFHRTPEKLLLCLCKKAKVLGISATATIPSVICNYDIDYLAEKLKDKYIEITEEERGRLKKAFQESTRGYQNVCIHTQLIGGKTYSSSAWKEVINNREAAEYLFGMVELACSDEQDNYNKERYLRIAVLYKIFLEKQEIQSFLCVLTKHPRVGDKALDFNVLLDLFSFIASYYGSSNDLKGEKSNIIQLDGDNYDRKKEEIVKRLGNGERLFVMSAYQTIGDGQNLQYPIPESIRNQLIKVNDYKENDCKDFDAIYLDMPTNMITQLSLEMSDEDFIKYLFQVEMLQENGEISINDAEVHIKKAFQFYEKIRYKFEHAKSMNNTRSSILMSMRIVIQAIGRICRTNMKSEKIYIFADSRLKERIDLNYCHGKMYNNEFLSLLSVIKSTTDQYLDPEEEYLTNDAQLISCRSNSFIQHMICNGWDENSMEQWIRLREMLLVSPTTSERSDENGIIYNMFVELPREDDRIYYIQENDFRNIQVFFSKKRGTSEVSAEASNLKTLMQVDLLRDAFKKNGWANSFKPGKYIMSPPLFNNIYRGALGEAAGKILFKYYADVNLKEIEEKEKFEKFDFFVPHSSIYVDFKNWHESSQMPSDRQCLHIVEKAKECGAKCVIIANILAEHKWAIRKKLVDDIKIVIIPALLSKEKKPNIIEPAWEQIRRCLRDYTN